MQEPIEIINVGTDWIGYILSLVGILVSGFFSLKLYQITRDTRNEQQQQKKDLSDFYFQQAKAHAGKMVDVVHKNFDRPGEVCFDVKTLSRDYNIPDLIFDTYFEVAERKTLVEIKYHYDLYINENWVQENNSAHWKDIGTVEQKEQINKVSIPYHKKMVDLFNKL
ncbi:hypothetical protein D3C74_140850 [compost metagenome]